MTVIVKSMFRKKTDESSYGYTDEIYFESDESLIESYEICFASDISEYIGTDIFWTVLYKDYFSAILTSENNLEIT